MNKWRIFGYTVVTWLAFSVLAKLLVFAYQPYHPAYSIIDAQSVVWSWMSLLMGAVAAFKFKSWREVVWGILFFAVCLVPVIGFFAGIGYFAWIYTKLERLRFAAARRVDQNQIRPAA